MGEAPCVYPNLNDQQQFRLNKTNEVIAEIKEGELMIKRSSKYIAFFDNIDKYLIFLSGTSGIVSIASFATVTGALVGVLALHFQ